MFRKLIFICALCFSFSAYAGKLSGFHVEFDTVSDLNYGTQITFRFFEIKVKEKGKDKEKEKQNALNLKDASDIKVKTSNCEFVFRKMNSSMDLGGTLTLLSRPLSITDSVCTVVFTLEEKEKSFEKKFSFTLNYKGLVRLNFNGRNGISPGDKKIGEKLFNYTETTGANGGDGEPGVNIQVNITKIYSKEKKDSFYVAKVLDLDSSVLYEYKIIPSRFKNIIIESKG